MMTYMLMMVNMVKMGKYDDDTGVGEEEHYDDEHVEDDENYLCLLQ